MSGFGLHRDAVAEALIRAFPTREDLDELVADRDLRAPTLTSRAGRRYSLRGDNVVELVNSLIGWAEDHGLERELIEAALELNPSEPALARIAENVLKY